MVCDFGGVMTNDEILAKAQARRRAMLETDERLDGLSARVVVDEACRGNPRLREAIDLLLAEKQALIEHFQAEAKTYADQDRTRKAARERWVDKPRMPDLVARIAINATAERTRPFESVKQCAATIIDDVNAVLDTPTTADAIRRYIPKNVTTRVK
jgi:hypothetical protein